MNKLQKGIELIQEHMEERFGFTETNIEIHIHDRGNTSREIALHAADEVCRDLQGEARDWEHNGTSGVTVGVNTYGIKPIGFTVFYPALEYWEATKAGK